MMPGTLIASPILDLGALVLSAVNDALEPLGLVLRRRRDELEELAEAQRMAACCQAEAARWRRRALFLEWFVQLASVVVRAPANDQEGRTTH